VCVPLFVLVLSALGYVTFILAQHARGHYALRIVQLYAAVGYTISLLCIGAAVVVTMSRERLHEVPLFIRHTQSADTAASAVEADTDSEFAVIDRAQHLLCMVAVAAFSVCVVAILNYEGRMVANTRGFRDPLPLSRYPDGWRPTPGGGDVYTILLGTIQVRLPTGGRRRDVLGAEDHAHVTVKPINTLSTLFNGSITSLFAPTKATPVPEGKTAAGISTHIDRYGSTQSTPTAVKTSGVNGGIELQLRSNGNSPM
jgi:hypothetical protein